MFKTRLLICSICAVVLAIVALAMTFDKPTDSQVTISIRGQGDEVLRLDFYVDRTVWSYSKPDHKVEGTVSNTSYDHKLFKSIEECESESIVSKDLPWSWIIVVSAKDSRTVTQVKDREGKSKIAKSLFAKGGVLVSATEDIKRSGFYVRDSMIYDLLHLSIDPNLRSIGRAVQRRSKEKETKDERAKQ